MVSLIVFIMATLEIVLGQKKLLDGRNGPFGDNVFKNPARLFFCFILLLLLHYLAVRISLPFYILYKLLLY